MPLHLRPAASVPQAETEPYEQFVHSPRSHNLNQVDERQREEALNLLLEGLPWELLTEERRVEKVGRVLGMTAGDLTSEIRADSSKRVGDLLVRANFRKSDLPLTLPLVTRDLVRYFHLLTPEPSQQNFSRQLEAAQDGARIRSNHLDRQPLKLAQFERLLPRLRDPWVALWVIQQDLSLGQEQLLIERLGFERPRDLDQAARQIPRVVEEVAALPPEVAPIAAEFTPESLDRAAAVLERYQRPTEVAADLCIWAHKYRKPEESEVAALERLVRAEFITGSILGLEGVSPERQERMMELRLAGFSREEASKLSPPGSDPIEVEVDDESLRVGDYEIPVQWRLLL